MFSHYVDSTTVLSDELLQLGVDHEVFELPESVTAALDAQHAMIAFAAADCGVRGGRQWNRAARLLRPLVARAARRASSTSAALGLLDRAVTTQRAGLLTYAADAHPAPVQLMGFYQTKGRKADATVVVLRSNDFYSTEPALFPVGSRLLYVVFTRARQKTILFGNEPPGLVAPLARLAALQEDRAAAAPGRS